MSDTSRQITINATLSDDGSGLVLIRELTRVLGESHADADERHQDESSPFHDGDLVGTIGAVCTVRETRPDAGPIGISVIHKGAVDGPVEVSRTGTITDRHGGCAYHGGADKVPCVMSAVEQRHWSEAPGGIELGRLGEDLLTGGDIDDVEIDTILSIGDPNNGGLRVRVIGVYNPCAIFARGMGHADQVEAFSAHNRVGVYLSVLTEGAVQTDDEIRVVSSPGHRVTCRRWLAYHDPRDIRGLLNSEILGNCVIADLTKRYVRAAAHEWVG